MNAIERVGCDPAAIAKARRELPVVNGASSEGRLGEAGLTAIIRYFLKQLLGVHDTLDPRRFRCGRSAALRLWMPFSLFIQSSGQKRTTTNVPISEMGNMMGNRKAAFSRGLRPGNAATVSKETAGSLASP